MWKFIVLTCWVSTLPLEALLVKEETINGKSVLVVRDCGPQFGDEGCTEEQESFYPGDGARVRAALQRKKFDEVYLVSNGGSLVEGVEVGRALRQAQATVRVPSRFNCISACTVAFMGGLFRFVDRGATYQVHAASTLSRGFMYRPELLKRLLSDTEGELKRFAVEELRGNPPECANFDCDLGARAWAKILFEHFQQGLLPLGTNAENAQRLGRWLRTPPDVPYLNSSGLKQDMERILREGTTAAQEILMRIERDSMAQAIAELRALVHELGPRATPALNMLEAMYSSRITETASLSPETLLKMGYVTPLLDLAIH